MPEISIVARAPVIRQADDSFHETLQCEALEYTITEGIGFDTASFQLTGPVDYLISWFEDGLTRDVEMIAPDGGIAWNGYVNALDLTIGGNARTRNIDGMANRILYVYTPLTTANNPPTAGAQTTTTVNDTRSQEQYGVKLAIISGEEVTAATAASMALVELERYKNILTTETVSVGAGNKPSIKIQLRGYAHMANWYTYTQTASSGTANASAIIPLVLAADPNSVLSADTRNIDTNTMAIEQYWDGKQMGWKAIQTIAERGYETGGYGYPWAVGVYEGRRVTFKQCEGVDANGVPWSTNKYPALHRQLYDPGDSILDDAGLELLPWQVRPDRLVYTAGLPGRPLHVQQVKFNTPFKVVLSGTDDLNPWRTVVVVSPPKAPPSKKAN